MQILAGQWRGKKLHVPPGLITRPTPVRLRAAMFSWLTGYWSTIRHVLDLFAGSGALGLESLSRSTAIPPAKGIFVESHPQAAAALRRNCRTYEQQCTVYAMPYQQALTQLAHRAVTFDMVFLDPPYQDELLLPALTTLLTGPWLRPDAWIFCEHHASNAPTSWPKGFSLVKTRTMGNVTVCLGQHL